MKYAATRKSPQKTDSFVLDDSILPDSSFQPTFKEQRDEDSTKPASYSSAVRTVSPFSTTALVKRECQSF